jgi:hypothetical protein
MPDYVENKLIINGDEEKIKEVVDFLKSKDELTGEDIAIDFNKITPMPKWVYNKSLSSKTEEKYGKENCWYQWSIDNWDTKWNAFGLEGRGLINKNTITFRTAWSGVSKLIRKLSIIFKDVEFEYYTCDYDDYGQNIYKFKVKDYEILEEIMPQYKSEEAINIFNFIIKELGEELILCRKCNTLSRNNIGDNYCSNCDEF